MDSGYAHGRLPACALVNLLVTCAWLISFLNHKTFSSQTLTGCRTAPETNVRCSMPLVTHVRLLNLVVYMIHLQNCPFSCRRPYCNTFQTRDNL